MKKLSRSKDVMIPKNQKSQQNFGRTDGRTYEYSDDNTPSGVNSAGLKTIAGKFVPKV